MGNFPRKLNVTSTPASRYSPVEIGASGWMVGAKFDRSDRASLVMSPGALGVSVVLLVLIPLSLVLAQCGQAPSAGALAANVQASSGDSFDDRFPAPQFRDRFPTTSESLVQRQPSEAPRQRAAQVAPAPYRVASL